MRRDDELDRVVPIDQLSDYQIAEGDPDVRGWDVISADGRRVGEVKNLLVDTAAMKVRYLDMKVDTDLLREDTERHALIPIGFARIERDDKNILVQELNSQDVATLPVYGENEAVTREYETRVRESWDRDFREGGVTGGTDFYANDAYDDSRFRGEEDRRIEE